MTSRWRATSFGAQLDDHRASISADDNSMPPSGSRSLTGAIYPRASTIRQSISPDRPADVTLIGLSGRS
jgi:hypothetical protein